MGSIDYITIPPAEKYLFTHENLGELIGWTRGHDAVQFRGIPYASIPGRFRQSILNIELPSQPFLATNPGPACPQPDQPYFKYWEAPLPDDLPTLEPAVFEEFGCLNLSLTIPKKSLDFPDRKTPVLVFIHGGAFVNGSHSIQLSGREVFDGTGIVRHSLQLGKDIIVVGINYRVGPLGFLASRQILEWNKRHEEDIGNYGLHDQRRALEWLSRFVAGFGGDPENITIQGTSAGAASCHYLSTFPEHKFKRAIFASGTAIGIGAMPLSHHQQVYDHLLQVIAPEVPINEGLEEILYCDIKHLTHGVPWTICNPLIENAYIHESNYKGPAHGEDLPDIMLGATAFEEDLCHILFTDLETGKTKSDAEILEQVKSSFTSNHIFDSPNIFPAQTGNILEAYRVKYKTSKPSNHLKEWGHLLGNIMFNIPCLYVALAEQKSTSTSRIWLYHYGITNTYPWSHSFRKAHHGVNDLLLFNPAPDMIPSADRASWDAGVLQTQRSWIEFVNGESPWAPVRRISSVDAVASLGPIFYFADHGESREIHTLKECIGEDQTKQYESVLQASRLTL